MKKEFFSSVYAGLLIAIATIISYFLLVTFTFSNLPSALVLSFLFPIGLFVILTLKLNLFTGRIFSSNLKDIDKLGIYYVGNLIGTFIGILLILPISQAISMDIFVSAIIKTSYPLYTAFVRAVFCNMLVCLSVNACSNTNSGFSKFILTFIPISAMIFCGFEHSIANMFILGFALINAKITLTTFIIYLLVVTAGNIVGGYLIKLLNYLSSEN